MDNKKIPTILGIIIIVIIAVTVGMFVWKIEESNEKIESQALNMVPQQNQETQEYENNQENELSISEPIENWKIYQNNNYNFKFKYPIQYSIEAHETSTTGEYFIKNNSDNIAHVKLKKWKGYIIKEGTPGTEYEKRAYYSWKYIFDNFSKIKNGGCDNNLISHVPGPTIAEMSRTCIVNKQENYIKIETESSVIFYTKEAEILWESKPQNLNLIRKMTSTFAID